MPVNYFLRRAVLALMLLGFGISPGFAQTGAAVVLRVTGEVNTPLAFSKQDLQALPREDYSENRTVVQNGKEVTLTVRYQGVPLRQLIDQAGLKPDRHAVRKAVVLLTAQDGYQASFSWGELYNSSLGDGVIVVLRHGPDELLDTDGFASLRSLQDLRPGPRHVRWLKAIEVQLP